MKWRIQACVKLLALSSDEDKGTGRCLSYATACECFREAGAQDSRIKKEDKESNCIYSWIQLASL